MPLQIENPFITMIDGLQQHKGGLFAEHNTGLTWGAGQFFSQLRGIKFLLAAALLYGPCIASDLCPPPKELLRGLQTAITDSGFTLQQMALEQSANEIQCSVSKCLLGSARAVCAANLRGDCCRDKHTLPENAQLTQAAEGQKVWQRGCWQGEQPEDTAAVALTSMLVVLLLEPHAACGSTLFSVPWNVKQCNNSSSQLKNWVAA